MSNKTVVNFEEKHHIIILDNKEYEIPQRTAARGKLLEEYDKDRNKISEYEAGKKLLTILFGEDNFKEMFPEDEEHINLDKMAHVCDAAVSLYNSEFDKIMEKRAAKQLKLAKPILDTVGNITNYNATKQFVAKKKK